MVEIWALTVGDAGPEWSLILNGSIDERDFRRLAPFVSVAMVALMDGSLIGAITASEAVAPLVHKFLEDLEHGRIYANGTSN